MDQVVIAAVIVALAAVAAVILERRRSDAPTQATWSVPAQLDRDDFARPHAPWLVVTFTSAMCDSCRDTVTKARLLAADDVAFQDVEVGAAPELHRRYGIDAVPIVVLTDADGVVVESFVGPPPAADLWAAVARVRDGQAGGPA
jgi:hypothetical protein